MRAADYRHSVTSTEIPTLRAICWGTRGSIPSPGGETLRYGGNTSCLEVRTAEEGRLIFDAGTGIRALGRHLISTGSPVHAHLFLTHFHWDHIQGFPFFEPLYDSQTVLRIHGPPQGDQGVQHLLTRQMSTPYFPVSLDQLSASLEFFDLAEGVWRSGEVEVAAMRVCHPGTTYGYRVRINEASLAYIPDNELPGTHCSVPEGWYGSLLEFLSGVDCLFHDAMFTAAELPDRLGWGHSTFEHAVQLAEDAGVRCLSLFHHAPDRSDAELERILEGLREDLARRGSRLEVSIAAEGEERIVQNGGR